jgi:hypothetical protein
MPEPDFRLKTGDNASIISSYLENSGGTAVSVAAATVLFKTAPISGGTLTFGGTATIDGSGTAGHVSYAWPTGGFSTSGLYLAEWEVTYSTGTVQSFPNDGYLTILVTDDL